jgi:uracil-DNA glycosylase
MFKELKELEKVAKKHELYKNVISTKGNVVFYRGNLENPKSLFIGEAPGQTENKVGKPFVGRSGKLLDGWMESIGIDDFVIINTVPIIPLNSDGGIRKPTKLEIDYFRPSVDKLIKVINPSKIICLGRSALEYVGLNLDNLTWKGNIGFIYHPAYYLRRGQNGIEDFKKLVNFSS